MAKVITGVAMIAGAVALNFIPGIGNAVSAMMMTHIAGVTAAGITSAASTMLGTMGVGMTLSSIAQALQGGGQPLSQSVRQPMAPRVTIYGQTRVGGVNIFTSVPNNDSSYSLYQVIAWASHPCASIDFLYLDGREVYFTGNNHQAVAGADGYTDEANHYDPSGNKYNFTGSGNYHVYAKNFLGSTSGHWFSYGGKGLAAPPPPGGDYNFGGGDPNWDASCTLNGICATAIAAASNPNMFQGIPNPKAALRGKCDIYDPRLGAQFLGDGVTPNPASHIWTDNAALIIADYLTNTDFGVGCDWDEIDIDSLIAAANLCDEQVELAGPGDFWQASWTVLVGQQILLTSGNIATVVSVSPSNGLGETGITQPTWPSSGTVSDNQVTWNVSPSGVTATWQAQTKVSLGSQIIDPNGNIETVVAVPMLLTGLGGAVPGTGMTGASAPTWPATAGGTVTDGNVTWKMSPNTLAPKYESRYTINGSFDWSTAPGDILTSMLAACEGRLSYQGGVWKIFPAAWYGSSLSFGVNDLAGPVQWRPRRKFRDLFNTVRATFLCPVYPYSIIGYDKNHKDPNVFDGQFQPTDVPPYMQDYLHGYGTIESPYQGDANLQADAGVRLFQDVRYQFVQSVATAQRLMKIRLLRNRFQGTGSLKMKLSGLRTCPEDVIQMTVPYLGWSNKYLEVHSDSGPAFRLALVEDHGSGDGKEPGAPTLGCELEVCETDPSIYAWSVAEEMGLQNTQSPLLAQSNNVVDPTGLTLESDLSTALVSADGIAQARIKATWTEPADPFTTTGGSIIVQYQATGDSTWKTAATVPGTTTECFISGLIIGGVYNVRVMAQHAGGAAGNWVEGLPITASVFPTAGGASVLTATLVIPSSPGSTPVTLGYWAQTVAGVALGAASDTTVLMSDYTYWYIDTADSLVKCAGACDGAPSFSLMTQTGTPGRISLGCLPMPASLGPGSYPVYLTAS